MEDKYRSIVIEDIILHVATRPAWYIITQKDVEASRVGKPFTDVDAE